jgi:hypothetical protein
MKILGAVASARREDREGLEVVLPSLPKAGEAQRGSVFPRDVEGLFDRFRR